MGDEVVQTMKMKILKQKRERVGGLSAAVALILSFLIFSKPFQSFLI